MMKKILRSLALILLCPVFLAGCATTITNLTPSTQTRSQSGLYPIEVAVDTRQQTLQQETITPYVLIGTNTYPMQQTMLVKNRWETVVPISADREYLSYQFKLDYEYLGIPERRKGSKLSAPYQLRILDN
jgi:hypothetical protein